MAQAARRADAGRARVIPILMHPTANWQNTPIGKLEPLPTDREPVSNRADREKALSDIAEQLRHVIGEIS